MFHNAFKWSKLTDICSVSANAISCANDLTNLVPKYINIRRGVIMATVFAGWAMVPWKIISSAESLLTFMSGLAVFLLPVAGLIACDYWIVKRGKFDVPSLYRRHARYRYNYGTNWRAAVACAFGIVPCLPGLAHAVTPSVKLSQGAEHLWDMNMIYSFFSASLIYTVLSLGFPARETLLSEPIRGELPVYDFIEVGDSDKHKDTEQCVEVDRTVKGQDEIL